MVLAAVGVGTLLAALNVSYRDFRYVIPFLVQLWMFATPSVYMQVEEASETAPRGWPSVLMALNPMTALIEAFRAATLGGPIPWASLGSAAACVVVACVVGCLYFRKVEDGFADII